MFIDSPITVWHLSGFAISSR